MSRITKRVKADFDAAIATMKQKEQANGLWCVCGHSSPTHDVGFTCQATACNCLNFRPSNAAPAELKARVAELEEIQKGMINTLKQCKFEFELLPPKQFSQRKQCLVMIDSMLARAALRKGGSNATTT